MPKADRLKRCYQQVLRTQWVLSAAAVLIAAMFGGVGAVFAAVLGAALAMMNSWLSQRAVSRSSRALYRASGAAVSAGQQSSQAGMAPIFISLMQRMALFAAGIGLGLAVWQLSPLYMLGAFALLQLATLACTMTAD